MCLEKGKACGSKSIWSDNALRDTVEDNRGTAESQHCLGINLKLKNKIK